MAPRSNSLSDQKDIEAVHLDNVNTANTFSGLSAEDLEFVANFPEEKKKKVLAKIDVCCAVGLMHILKLTMPVATDAHAGYSVPGHIYRQGQYRKRKDRRNVTRSEDDWRAIQHCSVHLLYSLYVDLDFRHVRKTLTQPDILAEVPSNMILNKFAKPSQYMATIMFIWGIVVVCTGLIHNFGQLCAIRILLGLFE